ncbi:MAG: magnesium transporter [Thermodesulfobacteriota bacterium]
MKDSRIEEVKALLHGGDVAGAGRLLAVLHPSDTARVLEGIEQQRALEIFRSFAPEFASEVLLELDERLRKAVLSSIPETTLVEVVEEMETDDAADVISGLPSAEARKVLDGIDWKESIHVQKLLKYPDDTAGGKMQAELVSVVEDATVEETIEEVRRKSDEVENISSVFVVDGEGRLVGAVPLTKLIFASAGDAVRSVADTGPVKVSTDVDQEEVARMFQRYDLLSMPVVDGENRLVGRITIDDVVDVIEEEIFEDFYRMASLNTGERALDPPGRSFGMRSPWLLLNLGTAFIAASVVKLFEGTIESMVMLAVLMPVVAGLGGNAATQTITVVVRGFALGEIGMANARKLLIKEVMVGLGNGLLVGAVAALFACLIGASFMVGVLLFLAMTASLVVAGFSGAVIPLILKWLNADPALSASVFVTACTDVGGFFTLLGLAALFMKAGWL